MTRKYLFEAEADAIRSQERAKADRRVERVEEKAKKDRAKFKEASKKAHAEHAEELSAEKTKARLAITREAEAKVQLDLAREREKALVAKLNLAEELNETVIEGLANLMRVTGDKHIACSMMGVRTAKFDQWFLLGQSANADVIYRYFYQEIEKAKGELGVGLVKKLHELSQDKWEDIVNKEGEVVGSRMARRGDAKPVMFMAERLFPQTFSPRAEVQLPQAQKENLAELMSNEELEAKMQRELDEQNLQKELESRRQKALQAASPHKVVDTEGETVEPSEEP